MLGELPRAARNCAIVVAVALAAAVAAVALPLGGRIAVWSVAGGVALIFGLSGVVYAMAGDARRAAEGRVLARWRAAPEEWRAFVEREWAATHGAYYRRTRVPAAVAGLVGGAALWWLLGPWVGLPFGVGFLAFPVLADRFHRWFAGRGEEPAEAVITDREAGFEGAVLRWRDDDGDVVLGAAGLEEAAPAVLVLGGVVPGAGGWDARVMRIPVPAGREDEAREVLGRLRALIVEGEREDG